MNNNNPQDPSLTLDSPKQIREEESDPVNDYSRSPGEVETPKLADTLGSATGEDEHAIMAGGWAGTDDATSTAPSDMAFMGPERPTNHSSGTEDVEVEDPTGRADAGGFGPDEGGVADFTGAPVGESRDWEKDSVLPNERMNEGKEGSEAR